MDKKLWEQLEHWHEEEAFEEIIRTVSAIPPEERDYALTGILARALNNAEDYEAAAGLLDSVREEGESDPLWHYRKGFALYYLDRIPEAKGEFERAVVLNPSDDDARDFIQWCDEKIGGEAKSAPEQYTAAEMEAVEDFIGAHFGQYDNVFHEISSPDIHVDICIINPTPERNYYTLVTLGMGAHRMKVPEELREEKLDRAEVLVCLSPDWRVPDTAETWYWPLRWLKILARLPGNEDSWLGWGHTVPNGKPFAENTKLSGVLLVNPVSFGEGVCVLPDGDEVNFYQMVPLYGEEMDFKVENGVEALLERMDGGMLEVVDVARSNVCRFQSVKTFFRSTEELQPLLTGWDGPDGCIATDRILVDGEKVGYLYREEPDNDADSGWRFTAGDETDEYMDEPKNSGIYSLNTLCNYDPEIIPLLHAPFGTAYLRDEAGVFQKEEFLSFGEGENGEDFAFPEDEPEESGMTFRERADAFWAWFQENEGALSERVENHERYGSEEIVKFIAAGTGLVSDALHFNVGGDHEFNFAVEGNDYLFYLLPWLIARQPEETREKWRFFPCIQGSHGTDFGLGMYGAQVAASEVLVRIAYSAERNRFSLWFFEKQLCALEEDKGYGAFYLLMENCIGEGLARIYIENVERAEEPEEGMFPLNELERRMADILEAAGKTVQTQPDQIYTVYERPDPEGTDLREDIRFGMTCYSDLVDGYYEEDPVITDALGSYGARAVFLSYPCGEDPRGALELRHELEDCMEPEVLGERGSGRECGILLGGAMGTERAYVDLLLYDVPAFWEKIGGLLRQYPCRFTLSGFRREDATVLICPDE